MTDITFTAFKGKPRVAKGYDLNIAGGLIKVPADPFYTGSFKTICASVRDVPAIIKSMNPGEFLTAGAHATLSSGNCPNDATRSAADFKFPSGPGLLVIDGDSLSEFGINSEEDFIHALNKLDPALIPAAVVMSPSASSGIAFNGFKSGFKGVHAIIGIDDAKTVPVVLETLHKRSVLIGLARAQITGDGKVLIRSIIDMALKTANQPIFVAGARMLNTAITQEREVTFYGGDILISANVVPLTAAEEIAYTDACARVTASVQSEAEAVRLKWHADRVAEMTARGTTNEQARQTLARANGGDLFGNYVINTDRFGSVTVANILANAAKFHGATCADPFDPKYGQNKAKIYSDQDKPVINSMAHGGSGPYFLIPETDLDFDMVDDSPKHSRAELVDMINATTDFDELTQYIAKLVCKCDLKEAERDSLRKLIAKKAGVSLASIKADSINFDGGASDVTKLNHLKASREVITSYGEANLIGSAGFLWGWSGDGVWRIVDDRQIKQSIHAVTAKASVTAAVVGSMLDLIKTEAYLPNHQFDRVSDMINCVNGELLCTDGAWSLEPHDRSHYRTAMIPVAYDPDATAPRFKQFLAEVFKGDPDCEEKSLLVCEFLGYTLTTNCKYERFLMTVGSGANGKSVLLAIIAELVGRDAATSVQPSQFINRFQRAHLQGKLANIVTETAEGATIADAELKSLVSGEMTTAEHKHQAPFDFTPYAKHIFATNHLPRTRDFSQALFRRALILSFNNRFDGVGRDVHLIDKLKAELPGILNMALAGLKRLNENKAFTVCSSSLEIASKWRRESDQVAQFVEEAGELHPDKKTAIALLYDGYKAWAFDGGVRYTITRSKFTERLELLGLEKSRGKGGTWSMTGIGLRPKIQGDYITAEFESNDEAFV